MTEAAPAYPNCSELAEAQVAPEELRLPVQGREQVKVTPVRELEGLPEVRRALVAPVRRALERHSADFPALVTAGLRAQARAVSLPVRQQEALREQMLAEPARAELSPEVPEPAARAQLEQEPAEWTLAGLRALGRTALLLPGRRLEALWPLVAAPKPAVS
jgi:hypothetical protein